MSKAEDRAAWHRWAADRRERELAAVDQGADVGNTWRLVPGAQAARDGDERIGGYTFQQWAALLAWTFEARGERAPWKAEGPTTPRGRTLRY